MPEHDVVDIYLTNEHREFRANLRALLTSDEMAEALAAARAAEDDLDPRPVHTVLGRRGWLAPHWPVRYGGLGADALTGSILTEELAMHGIPDSAHVNTIRNAGSYLLQAGTGAQCDRYLPALASGQALMAVLYSEPAAGSDLAALETTARARDGHWLISGTKLYSVKTAAADYGLIAARTSRHGNNLIGITLFVVHLNGPGVDVQRVDTMNVEPFYRVTFDDVMVSEDQVIGLVDGGWLVVTEALSMERVGIDFNAKVRSWLHQVRALAERTGRADDPMIRGRLSELDTSVAAGRSLAWEMVRRVQDGELDPAEAAMSKWFNSELGPPLAELALEVAGAQGVLTGSTANSLLREAPGLTLSAGTSEMMLYVISTQFGLQGDGEDD
ncbi:MAG TPA: acyl-CoA dehydrogenase family protein [Pseudonocardiaceae bacterium]|nr:acyl-CoA dehydrogenase family protein [Pseudonocardiaceae bacterium]